MTLATNYKSKSILAKLLASEDIKVEVKNTRSAYFDLKSRTVVIPSWKDISTDIYDLFIGHEIGHALFTPEQGWHNTVNDFGKEFKSYLNVIEDARIEKLIKTKYPGLKQAFYRGYNELNQKDFFGVHSNQTASRLFIDRINLHYKIGSMCNIKFSDAEELIIEEIDSIKTWEDVVSIAKKIFEHDKANKNLYPSEFDDLKHFGDYDIVKDLDDIFDDFEIDSKSSNEFSDSDLPMSETDQFFRNKMETLSDNDKRTHHTVYVPDVILNNVIVHHKELYNYIDKHFNNDTSIPFKEYADLFYREFLSRNKTHIQYLIKEFELKRNAKQFARAKVSKIGELDTKKAFSYKIKDDIFKQITVVPNGKSHGLVMFIDMSGSMGDIIKETIEQTIILAIFCRKLSIPFKIYGFSDNYNSAKAYLKNNYSQNIPKFSQNSGEYVLNNNVYFHLKEYLSSDMSNKEFVAALKTWIFISTGYNDTSRASYNLLSENLSNTPLQHAVVAAMDIVPKFKAANKLDIVNTILLTDGEASSTEAMYSSTGGCISLYGYMRNSIVHMNHRKTGKSVTIKNGDTTTNGLIQMLREVTDTRVIGFYLLPKNMSVKRGIISAAKANGTFVSELDDAVKQAKKEKVYCLESLGYDKNFVVPSLEIIEEELDIDKDKTKAVIRNAFIRLRKNKNSNRILLNKFVEKIA